MTTQYGLEGQQVSWVSQEAHTSEGRRVPITYTGTVRHVVYDHHVGFLLLVTSHDPRTGTSIHEVPASAASVVHHPPR
jgi:hypothetical protein